ncbi:anti-sigma factor [Streptomyces sp. NBC_00474]|uniref:anti-sigma factor family protein n=1 Tax=Streptomyces sp. NBC_00474 TaxID=2975754 RepID=UPI00224F4690|nr:anti-sigma factor [Streptomyces sp. NBC_00474]MCX5050844.1 anti-sigma factor [Streptomyces sp. NBC_00474]
MSGTRPSPAERRLAEQHLGDRLSALVDGELGHESRDRVLAHLATCARCKAEADAQRRLKNVFAEAAPPPPSESFLARLQGLPEGGDDPDGGSPFGGGGLPGSASGKFGTTGVFGMKRGDRFEFGYVPSTPHVPSVPHASASVLPDSGRGFRIHDVSRHEAERSASRGMRFAFVAAGAVSLAAIALGGVTTVSPTDTADARGGTGAGSNVTPMRTQGTGASTAPENQRRRGSGPLLAQGRQSLGDAPVAPTEVSAPLLPGVPSPAGALRVGQQAMHTLTPPVMAGAAVMSPLIRPLSTTPPLTLTSWSTAPEAASPGLLAAPLPDSTTPPSSPHTSR